MIVPGDDSSSSRGPDPVVRETSKKFAAGGRRVRPLTRPLSPKRGEGEPNSSLTEDGRSWSLSDLQHAAWYVRFLELRGDCLVARFHRRTRWSTAQRMNDHAQYRLRSRNGNWRFRIGRSRTARCWIDSEARTPATSPSETVLCELLGFVRSSLIPRGRTTLKSLADHHRSRQRMGGHGNLCSKT